MCNFCIISGPRLLSRLQGLACKGFQCGLMGMAGPLLRRDKRKKAFLEDSRKAFGERRVGKNDEI